MEEQTGHNSADLIITDSTLYSEQQCVEYNENTCIHWVTYYPEQSINIYKTSMAESNSNVLAIGLVLALGIWLIKGIFRLILPSRGK